MVYAQALMAIVGALMLEQGSEVANRVTRERIISQMSASERSSAAIEEQSRDDFFESDSPTYKPLAAR